MYRHFFKRFFDVAFSAILMLFLLPVYVILAVVVRVSMGSPILFSQRRIGKDEKIFSIYKFRSMTNKRDEEGNLLSEEERLTRAGALMRSLSLDELPELWSIFIGDMSFVGPRPLREEDLPYFKPHERVRHNVRGGLIPPDSLSGKVFTTYEEQFEYEVYYANNVSLWLDMKIFFMTFAIVVRRVVDKYGSDFRPHLKEYRKDMNNDKNI